MADFSANLVSAVASILTQKADEAHLFCSCKDSRGSW